MIIRVQSSDGTKRIEVSETDSLSTLFDRTAKEFQLNHNDEWYLSRTRKISDAFKAKSATRIKSAQLRYYVYSMKVDVITPSVFAETATMVNSVHKRTVLTGMWPSQCNIGVLITSLLSTQKNGDMLYLIRTPEVTTAADDTASEHFPSFIVTPRHLTNSVQEDEVDVILAAKDGRIVRNRSEHFCHHPESGQCIHCVPLEPYDSAYLSHCDPPVKFMSFHAYLRKLHGGQSRGKFVRLENTVCTIKPGCTDHPAWPEGICTKCQPKPITLEVQAYRHVDYVQFENGQMMETFLDYWRSTGNQRIGVLLGRYVPFDTPGAPPLSIKAVVSAIYEPPQESTSRSVSLLCPLEELLPPPALATADALGLRPVGWIFTDLTPEDSKKGTVLHYRGSIDTFFLSAQECITAACLQNVFPNVSKYSPDGHFGSKFVTVVVTGGPEHQISFEAYQVSNVAMSLQRANILLPTYDAPELGYIRDTTKEQFVPDVFYSSKDKYGNTVTNIGRPLPVEYLLIDMPVAFPIDPTFTFALQSLPSTRLFPIENREDMGQTQNFEAFANYLSAVGPTNLRTCLSNFHVLAWLAGQVDLPLNATAGSFDELLKAVRTDACFGSKSEAQSQVARWAASSSQWATIRTMADSLLGSGSPESAGNGAKSFRDAAASSLPDTQEMEADADYWACAHCTFHNRLDSPECDMCRLPRSA
ncbi:unnamed protein product [Schistocephalus solidus]|uniref:Nuclear protein localization protein 4 homolog n=1 Tax=Schistocephalus solidus TaxID=70667 RepID=A0A183SJI7_SCHSO|nr:unnamed protein product [Schistocephalus solidus]